MTFIHIVLYTIKFSFNSIWHFFLKNSDFWNNVIMKLRNRWNKIHFPIRQSIRRFLPSLRRLIHMCGSFKRRRQIYFQFHSDVFDTMRKNHNDTRIWDHISWHVTIFTLKNNNCLFAFSGFTFCILKTHPTLSDSGMKAYRVVNNKLIEWISSVLFTLSLG